MNTTARLESSSKPGCIQGSKETADLLKLSGKEAWLSPRTDTVFAKGKGELNTFWVSVSGERANSIASVSSDNQSNDDMKMFPTNSKRKGGRQLPGLDERTYRLVDWNVETLLRIMKEIVAHRNAKKSSSKGAKRKSCVIANPAKLSNSAIVAGNTPLEEVREIIALPDFDAKVAKKQQNPEDIVIPDNVINELHHLVSVIASLYNKNPFHNFDHASVSGQCYSFLAFSFVHSRLITNTDLSSWRYSMW